MLHRADGAVPVIHVVQAQSVGDAAAREAHEARVQVGQRLDQIRAEMLEALIGGSRFEADEVRVDGAGFGESQAESALGGDDFGVGLRGSLCASNSQFGAELGPFAASIGGGCGHDSGSERLAIIANQCDLHGQRFAVGTGPDGKIVGLAGAEHHAVETKVFQSGSCRGTSRIRLG